MKKQIKANGYGMDCQVEAPFGLTAPLGNACRFDGRYRRNRFLFADCAGSQPCR
ncbi:hypothetical protein [Maricaulis sp.]|jgi:hypothetical protein|uniref:hypothetical protein n=1 Tax=Maricaulis sp. TaxID=1486257 RepID=UPI0026377987|nr:hypothetical protein [Maricaulis sp.]MDF1768968.1 hypothetical protein [Maricaulis sp.]